MEVLSKTILVDVTPTISTSIYSANDQVGGVQTITGAAGRIQRGATLVNITVVDKAAQSAALTIFFFGTEPTVASSDNAALNISDANMLNCLGAVTIAAADYETTSANSVATVLAADCCLALRSEAASGSLYAVVKTTGTPTYGSTSDLQFRYHFVQDA